MSFKYDEQFVSEAKRLIPIDPRFPNQMVAALHSALARHDHCVGGILMALQREWRLSADEYLEAMADTNIRERIGYIAGCAVQASHLHRQWSDQTNGVRS